MHHEVKSLACRTVRRLSGKNFLLTQPEPQSREFKAILKLHGGRVLSCPTIQIVPSQIHPEVSMEAITRNFFDWIIFTSKNTVRFFFDNLKRFRSDALGISKPRICAVGPETAELLESHGVRVHLVPRQYTAEGIVEAFGKQNETSLRILYPKGDLARNIINESLEAQGHKVYSPILYRTLSTDKLPEPALKALHQNRVNCVVFTSPSTVENLATILGKKHFVRMLATVFIASIGPITSQACRRYGLNVDVQPKTYTMGALAEEILQQANLFKKCPLIIKTFH